MHWYIFFSSKQSIRRLFWCFTHETTGVGCFITPVTSWCVKSARPCLRVITLSPSSGEVNKWFSNAVCPNTAVMQRLIVHCSFQQYRVLETRGTGVLDKADEHAPVYVWDWLTRCILLALRSTLCTYWFVIFHNVFKICGISLRMLQKTGRGKSVDLFHWSFPSENRLSELNQWDPVLGWLIFIHV